MKNDYILPIIVLSFICLVVSGALAFVNSRTQPIIAEAARVRTERAKRDIIPQADDFELLEIDGLPRRITGVYRATNNAGYIFMITTHGYAPEDIKLICGIDLDGRIIKTATLSQNETQGLGTPIFEQPHAGQYWGRDRDGIESISAITGATITSNAYKNGIRDAFTAFEIVKSFIMQITEER
jgi:electron transport complex protein RnfG